MTTHSSQLRVWLVVTCALLCFQGVVFWFTPLNQHTALVTDTSFAQVWPYIDQLEYENDDPQQGRALRWAPMQGVIRLPQTVHVSPMIVRMTLHTARALEQPPMQVVVTSDTTSTSFPLRPGWRTISLLAMPVSHFEQYTMLTYTVTGPILSERRDLGLAVSAVSLTQTKPLQIDGIRFLFVAGLWLWMLLIGVSRRWSQWFVVIPALVIIGTWMAFPYAVAYAVPNQWNLLGYLWLMTSVLLLLPYRRVSLSPIQSLVGFALVITLWQLGFGWLGVVLLIAVWSVSTSWPPLEWPDRMSLTPLKSLFVLAVALAVAGLLRIAWLNDYPTGLFRDEARHGGLAWRILAGEWMVYSPLANLPAGYFYVSAIPIALFDASAWSIRISAAVVGTISVLAMFWMLRPHLGAMFALWASVLLATLLWHVGLSRIGFPATMGPLLTMIAVGAWLRIPQAKWPIALAVCAGIATGLMLMVYHSARLMPFVVALTIFLVLWQRRWSWRSVLPALVIYAGVTLLIASPILWYALTQPDNYMRRIGVTSIMSDAHIRGLPVWIALFENVHAYIGMLFVAGDRNPRHFNLGAPQLNFVEALSFIVGMMWLWTQHRPWLVWLLGWLGIGLLSGVLSVDAPHALRTVESIVPIVIIVAAGAYRITHVMPVRWRSVILIVALIGNAGWSASQYSSWQAHPRTQSRFDTTATNDVRFVQQLAQRKPSADIELYVPEAMRRSDLGVFLLHQSGVRLWQGDATQFNQAHQNLVIVPIGTSTRRSDDRMKLLVLPSSMRERYELWCVGQCADVTWMEQP